MVVQAHMLQLPDVLCRPPQDEDPLPCFPDEVPSGGNSASALGFRLVDSMARLERRIEDLAGVLSMNPPTPHYKSTWSQHAGEALRPPWIRTTPRTTPRGVSTAVSVPGDNQSAASQGSSPDDKLCTQAACNIVTDDVSSAEHLCADEEPGDKGGATASGAKVAVESVKCESLRSRKKSMLRSASFIETIYVDTTAQDTSTRGRVAKAVVSGYFDAFMCVIVIANAVVIGATINLEAANEEPHIGFKYSEWCCTVIFTAELGLRIWSVGLSKMFSRGERFMSTMDALLVVIAVLETVLDVLVTSGTGLSDSAMVVVARVIKMLRLGRLLRPLRTVALFAELRVVAAMIAGSFRSLAWLLCILLAMAYCFALIITQGAATYFNDVAASGIIPEDYKQVRAAFGGVLTSMYSLLLAMTGGRDWGELSSLIGNAGMFYSAVLTLFVFVNLFSVLNIVTGVFVDGAIELAKRDRSMMIEKQNNSRAAIRKHLVALLSQLDHNGDGALSKDEFFSAMAQAEVQDFMDALGIDPDNAVEVFLLLDEDGDGMVTLQEFVVGMERIRGESKSIDIQMLRLYIKRIADEVAFMRGMHSQLLTRIPLVQEPRPTSKRFARYGGSNSSVLSVPCISTHTPVKDSEC